MMEKNNLFTYMGELLKEPVEHIANTKIIKKHVQQFNMSNGDKFRVTISKLATQSKPKGNN